MSGGYVSYHLRPNKFVERQLFVELLSVIDPERPPDEYVYVSLGGPQLEDQRLVHRRLGIKNLISLEADPVVYERQLFNLRPSYINCENMSTADFVRDFDAFADEYGDKTFIIWLDYSSARRRDQVVEYETLLGKLKNRDIIKITMNANPDTLGQQQSEESYSKLFERRLEKLQEQLDGYLPRHVTTDHMKGHGLIPILCKVIKKASLNALQHRPDLRPVHLAIFRYQDGPHLMLTITVGLIAHDESEQFCRDLVSRGWEYPPSCWHHARRINLPSLTAKERLYVEQLLFSKDHELVHKELPFWFHRDEESSLEALKEYARHYCRYPSYFRVVL